MVMAQYQNTQYVAHEFVRQYYTMLHKDPTQLHRFYTKESRLTHGVSPDAKSEEPVCGQEAIYEKIAALNFRNCYAKIRTIDSHPTIGGGVVIQVTGELSNSGTAMRKFMQTFVLARQDPKKYNVFNDIFRYQDETFEDTENEEGYDGANESENGIHEQQSLLNEKEREVNNEDEEENYDEEEYQEDSFDGKAENEYASFDNYVASMKEEVVEDMKDVEDTTTVGAIHSSEVEIQKYDEDFSENQKEQVTNVGNEEVHEVVEPVNVASQENAPTDDEEVQEEKPANIEQGEEILEHKPKSVAPEEPSKPVSWAALAKKNTVSATPSQPPPVAKPVPKKTVHAPKVSKRKEETSKKDSPDDFRRSTGPPPDEHQIFIGSLPVGVSEDEVREAFKEFGTIVEIRLNPKNFGFVAFNNIEAPQEILRKNKTIIIRNQAINIEVKRSVSGGGRGSSGGGGFRRERDSNRRNDFKNINRGQGNAGRPGKNNSFPQKQPKNEDGKNERNNKDYKRDQKSFKR